MKKAFYVGTCSTCLRILKEWDLPSNYALQDIKKEPLTVKQLDELMKQAGSYEALFSRRANLYKERNLKDETLTEGDYKRFILEHYTFLSRPVLVNGDEIFIGNSKKTVEAAKNSIHHS
ncbi:MAG: ArsC/Spx/MgsR family protein [Flavobacteriaceae bacterium]